MAQKLSKVWDHYTLNKEDNKVQCLYCKIELAYHNSTSSMIQHLNRRHPFHAVSPSVAETSTSQRSMDSFVRPAQSCTVQEAAIFTESILNMLVTDMRPLSMLDDKGFRDMISTFNPKYSLPSRTYFTQLMEKKHREIESCSKANRVCCPDNRHLDQCGNRGLPGGDMPLLGGRLGDEVPLPNHNAPRRETHCSQHCRLARGDNCQI
ncbi:zinc finger BED domain-containing protein [Pimephales promelas]|nr:zinc finger BED domain-containing protein [Pimephales promelas]